MRKPLPGHDAGQVGESGPLQRRILAGSQALRPSTTDGVAPGDGAFQYATIGMLDGTVIARLECDGSLGPFVLGRSSLADVRIEDPFVHRVHAEITWETDVRSHVITHSGGSNGTWVNLQRVDRPTRLTDGCRIRVGSTELVYRRVYYPGD